MPVSLVKATSLNLSGNLLPLLEQLLEKPRIKVFSRAPVDQQIDCSAEEVMLLVIK